jgi:hypothetical protein
MDDDKIATVDPDNLNQEFISLSGWFARYVALHAEAAREYHLAKLLRERLHASLYLLASSQEGKQTVDSIKAKVEASEDMAQAKEKEVLADVEMQRLKGMIEALKAKRDCLVSLGANMRADMQLSRVG